MITPEWSHKIESEHVGPRALNVKLASQEQVRKDVARRLKVESVDALEAEFTLQREPGNLLVRVQGTVKARITQLCVSTLELLKSDLAEKFEAFYTDHDEKAVSFAKAKHERLGRVMDAELQILDERADPEPAIDGKIDLGELAVQYLSLAIDPYPRAEGADANPSEVTEIAPKRRNPFAALKDWKAKRDREDQ